MFSRKRRMGRPQRELDLTEHSSTAGHLGSRDQATAGDAARGEESRSRASSQRPQLPPADEAARGTTATLLARLLSLPSGGQPQRLDAFDRADDRLASDVALARATMDTLLDPMLVLEPTEGDELPPDDFVVVLANSAAATALSTAVDDMVGRTLTSLASGPDELRSIRLCSRAWVTGTPVRVDDVVLPARSSGAAARHYDVRAVRVGPRLSFTWRDTTAERIAIAAVTRREAEYRLLADNATDVVLRSDAHEQIVFASPSLTEVLGWPAASVLGRNLTDLVHPEDLHCLTRPDRRTVEPGRTGRGIQFRIATATGLWRWVTDHRRTLFGEDGEHIGVIDSLRDCHTEHEALQALQASEEHYRSTAEDLDESRRQLRAVIDTLFDPWVELAAARDGDGRVFDFVFVDANDAACVVNHLTRDDLLGRRLLHVLPDHAGALLARYAAVVDTGVGLAVDEEPYVSPFDGVQRHFDVRAVKIGEGISLTWRDVTERVRARQHLHAQANHDALTGLPNRRLLLHSLSQTLQQRRRTGHRIAVLYCDLNGFKQINDTHGHTIGDQVLAAVATRIRDCVRDTDLVARLGGDEFVVVLNGVHDRSDADHIAAKITAAVAQPLALSTGTLVPTITIGATLTRPGATAEEALDAADRSLYLRKSTGTPPGR